MSEPKSLVDMLFDSLASAYAGQWVAKWDGLDMDMVKSIWAKNLEGLKVRHIKHGLANLPTDHPPNAMRFREICLQAPEPFVPMLRDATRKPNPKRLAEILATIPRGAQRNPLACAQRHLDRLRAGERLTPAQIDLVRAAIPSYAGQSDGEEGNS